MLCRNLEAAGGPRGRVRRFPILPIHPPQRKENSIATSGIRSSCQRAGRATGAEPQGSARFRSGVPDLGPTARHGPPRSQPREAAGHLRDHDSELANGFFQRNVNVGSVPAPVRVPRTHSGAFRPQVLPASLSVDNRAVKGPSAGIRPPSAHGPSAIRGWPAGPDPTGSAPSGYCRMTEARIGRQRGGTGAADRQEDAVASAAVADCLDSPAIPASGQPDRNRPLEVRRMCSSTLVDCGAAVTDAARAAPDRTDATRGQPAPIE